MIVVVDYGLGNVRSVVKIMQYIGCHVELTNDIHKIKNAERIVLPGVGAFKPAMAQLSKLDLIAVLTEEVMENKKPFLGLCLGMQLLSNKSYEDGESSGLGWVPGEVHLLDGEGGMKVPQFGWHSTTIQQYHPILNKLPESPAFYFAHSYHFIPKDQNLISMTMDYGKTYVAAIAFNNIFATQFHPEKSQEVGIRFFENFVNWNP